MKLYGNDLEDDAAARHLNVGIAAAMLLLACTVCSGKTVGLEDLVGKKIVNQGDWGGWMNPGSNRNKAATQAATEAATEAETEAAKATIAETRAETQAETKAEQAEVRYARRPRSHY